MHTSGRRTFRRVMRPCTREVEGEAEGSDERSTHQRGPEEALESAAIGKAREARSRQRAG